MRNFQDHIRELMECCVFEIAKIQDGSMQYHDRFALTRLSSTMGALLTSLPPGLLNSRTLPMDHLRGKSIAYGIKWLP